MEVLPKWADRSLKRISKNVSLLIEVGFFSTSICPNFQHFNSQRWQPCCHNKPNKGLVQKATKPPHWQHTEHHKHRKSINQLYKSVHLFMKMCYRRTVSVLSIEKHREAFSKTQHHPDSVSVIINMTEKTSTKRHFTTNRQKFPLLVALLIAIYFTVVLKSIFECGLKCNDNFCMLNFDF